uniref:junction-mediating and -regulatory protein-like n=1 Tax=Myxine glutinosa TaxID=7769 RepID=UPI00358E125B
MVLDGGRYEMVVNSCLEDVEERMRLTRMWKLVAPVGKRGKQDGLFRDRRSQSSGLEDSRAHQALIDETIPVKGPLSRRNLHGFRSLVPNRSTTTSTTTRQMLRRPLTLCSCFFVGFSTSMDSSSVDPGVDEADDWVAVRSGAFSPRDPQGGRARFLVGWNEGGRQFAITAHICWSSDNPSVASRTPSRNQNSRKDQSSNLMKTVGAAGEDDGGLLDDTWEDEGQPLKMKDWEEEFDEDVKGEGDGASKILSFAGLLTPAEMLSTHSEASLLCPALAGHPPPTPVGEVECASSVGFWSLLFPPPPPEPVSDTERAELCGAMEHYLSDVSDACGWRAVVWLLFGSMAAGRGDDGGAITEEECYESLGEVHRKALHDELRRMKKEIMALLAQHNSATSLVDLLALHDKEDVSVENVLSAAASLHQFLLQPFRELRALASLRRQQFRRQLDRGGLGPLRVNDLRRQRDVWTECERNATSRIEDITLKHYTFTSQILRVMLRAMQADSGRFGASAWDSATPRMLRLAVSVAMETLQRNQATELVLVQKRRGLKRQMLSLSRSAALEEPCVVDDTERTHEVQGAQPLVQLNRLESKCYDIELRVCDTRLHSLRLREQLISSHRHALQREMQEFVDAVCYHDAFESLEAMQEGGETGWVASGEKERLRSQDLELQARLADILSERARLRIKKERCISRRREKLHEQQEHERQWNLHHAVQLVCILVDFKEKQIELSAKPLMEHAQ